MSENNNENKTSGLGGLFLKMVSMGTGPVGVVQDAPVEEKKINNSSPTQEATQEVYAGDKSKFLMFFYFANFLIYFMMLFVPDSIPGVGEAISVLRAGFVFFTIPVVIALYVVRSKLNEFNKAHCSNLIGLFWFEIVAHIARFGVIAVLVMQVGVEQSLEATMWFNTVMAIVFAYLYGKGTNRFLKGVKPKG